MIKIFYHYNFPATMPALQDTPEEILFALFHIQVFTSVIT